MIPPESALAAELDDVVFRGLAEDVGPGDVTTLWTVGADAVDRARIVSKEPLALAGATTVPVVFARLDPRVEVEVVRRDGERVPSGALLFRLVGPTRALLTGERLALNILARLSGIATFTRRFVDAVAGTAARIVDTRKTTPGWRRLEKAAVVAGGGVNHRMGLHDMVLVKENHAAAAGGLEAAIERVRARNTRGLAIEVEVRGLAELDAVVALGVDRILLDNMGLPELREAVGRVRARAGPHPVLEASGNVTLANVRAVAESGVDLISVGALTHSAPAADLSMLLDR